MSYEIEKGVPVPPPRTRRKYRFDLMEPGDSFFAPDKTEEQLRAAAQQYRTRHARQQSYRVAEATEDGVSGVRIWRIA